MNGPCHVSYAVGNNEGVNLNMSNGYPPQVEAPSSNLYLVTAPVESAEVSGATNLLRSYDLNWAFNKFSSKKVKQPLSSFISHLPGPVDTPATEDESGLMALIEKPPPVTKEIKPLTGAQLNGFRLYPGPIPEQYKVPLLMETQLAKVKKHKKKKSKKRHQSGDAASVFNSNFDSSKSLSTVSISQPSTIHSNTTPSHNASLPKVTSLSAAAAALSSSVAASSTPPHFDSTSYSQAFTSTPESMNKRNKKRPYEGGGSKKKKDKKKKRKKEVLSD